MSDDWKQRYISLYKQFRTIRGAYIIVSFLSYFAAVACGIAWCHTKDYKLTTIAMLILIAQMVIMTSISLITFRSHNQAEREACEAIAQERKLAERAERAKRRLAARQADPVQPSELLAQAVREGLVPTWDPALVRLYGDDIIPDYPGHDGPYGPVKTYCRSDCPEPPSFLFTEPKVDDKGFIFYMLYDRINDEWSPCWTIPSMETLERIDRLDPPLS